MLNHSAAALVGFFFNLIQITVEILDKHEERITLGDTLDRQSGSPAALQKIVAVFDFKALGASETELTLLMEQVLKSLPTNSSGP